MKNFFLFGVAAAILFTSCASHHKKILVYASSEIQVDDAQKNVIVGEGTTHHEKELDFSGSDPVQLNVQSPAGKLTLEATDDGLYIINLKADTVVGSFQHIGADNGTSKISRERLPLIIDSLQKLVLGQNQSPYNKNYFIPPGKIAKVSAITGAKVFGPYTKIPNYFDAGSVPEIYKFYTNQEVREIIAQFVKINQSQAP